MSFSYEVKSETAKIEPESSCCITARAVSVLLFAGVYSGDELIKLSTESANVARFFCVCLRPFFKNIDVNYSKNFRNSKLYTVNCHISDDEAEFIGNIFTTLENCLILRRDVTLNGCFAKKCCLKTLVRAAFLSVGSVSSPKKTYHLEFSVKNSRNAELLKNILGEFTFHAKFVKRRNVFVLYFKDSEIIADILTFIGAHKMLLDFLDTKIIKELRNNTNRLVNCETANIQKTANASAMQIQSIKRIKSCGDFEALDKSLQELAELRLSNPEASLAELGEKCTPPITKSGVKRRMDKIVKLSSEL